MAHGDYAEFLSVLGEMRVVVEAHAMGEPVISVENLIKGERYFVRFAIPPKPGDDEIVSGAFKAVFDRLGTEGDRQLYAYFKSGDYLDIRHIVSITTAPEMA